MAGRTIQDAALKKSVALPNAANTTCTASIDLGAATPFPVTEHITVRVTTSIGTGANSKNINVVLQDSAESAANFTNIVETAVIVTTGNATKHIPSTANIALPPAVRRYIRAMATGEANGGDSSDGTLTIDLRF
jgi:hypothetical protein